MINNMNNLLKAAAEGDELAIQTILNSFKEQTIAAEEQEQIHRYLKAAKTPHAIYLRGLLYEYGYGVKQDYDMSFLMMREAAAKGHAKAIYEVGHYFLEGLGGERNYENALEWLSLAAGSPHYVPRAMYDLGRMYEEGLGVEVDLNQAKKWYENAAQKGLVAAKAKLLVKK